METSTAKVFHEIKSNQHAVFRNRDFAGTTSSMLHSVTSRVVGEVNDDIRADCRRAGGGLFAEVKSGRRSRAALAAREASTGGASNGGGSLSASACSGQTGGGRRNLVEWILDAERRSARRAAWEEKCARFGAAAAAYWIRRRTMERSRVSPTPFLRFLRV